MRFFHDPQSAWCQVAARPLPAANANLTPRCALEDAAWIWHPALELSEPAFVLFRLEFDWQGGTLQWSVSGDQRYELAVDGCWIGRGADSSAPECWAFDTYSGELAAGRHRAEALVWWLGSAQLAPSGGATPIHTPAGRMTWRGGFVLAAENQPQEKFHTGIAPWNCARLEGWSLGGKIQGVYHAIGSALHLDVETFHAEPAAWVPAATVRAPIRYNPHGLIAPGWRLASSEIPPQRANLRRLGAVRAGLPSAESPLSAPVLVEKQRADTGAEIDAWRELIERDVPAEVAPGASASVLCDFHDYVCGYPLIHAEGDALDVGVYWAEALFLDAKIERKGHRDEIAGRWFSGFGDTFAFSGGQDRMASTHWWRAGRYVWITLRNRGTRPARLKSVRVLETGYPLSPESGYFDCSDESLRAVQELCVRGLRACRHDVFCDTPYYEQMMYTADTRLEILMGYALWGEDRLARRAIALHDASRDAAGWTAMRFPSDERQSSGTFATIWVWMLHDFALWRDEPAWWQEKLPGVRALLDACSRHRDESGLLCRAPGWPFIDWVPEWDQGCPAGARDGVSCLVNLAYLLTLQKAADLERWSGHSDRADLLARQCLAVRRQVRLQFLREDGLLRDAAGCATLSEHAQVWGVLSGVFDTNERPNVRSWLIGPHEAARATVYFQFYLFEALRVLGAGDEILARMDFWRDLVRQGLLCPVESPEPTRSDCHAWGSHPVFHLSASVAGVRPSDAGFRSVSVRPQPGNLRALKTRVAHPQGWIDLELRFDGRACRGSCSLPSGVSGQLEWANSLQRLNPGLNLVDRGDAPVSSLTPPQDVSSP